MSTLTMTAAEERGIDSKVEQMMDWAKKRKAEAEQLALDSARLMSCSSERMDRLRNQNFFKRCWGCFTGASGGMERANVNDLIQMQKMAFRYVNMLQEQQLLMAHSMLSLKNNLLSLSVKEEETRNLIGLLAQRTLERFEKLENRVDQLEVFSNLQGWLLGLEEREYDEKIPTKYMRIFKIINDFYGIKNDNWNYNDLMFMRKALRTVGIDPKTNICINKFIDKLTDEIQDNSVGLTVYNKAITLYGHELINDYSNFVVDNISSPIFISMHGLKIAYTDRLDMVEVLQDNINIPPTEALKRLLKKSIENLNINLHYEFPLDEAAIEILGCIRLTDKLLLSQKIDTKEDKYDSNKDEIQSINKHKYTNDNEPLQNTYREKYKPIENCNNISFDIEKEIVDSLGSASKSDISNCYVRGYPFNAALLAKVQAGLKSFGLNINLTDIIVYYDSTLFGGGDEGFILTKDRIYFKQSFSKPAYIGYKSISDIKCTSSGFHVYVQHKKTEISCFSNEIREVVCSVLKRILSAQRTPF